jgi:hypothetical protein
MKKQKVAPSFRLHYLWRQRQYATSFTNIFIYMSHSTQSAHTFSAVKAKYKTYQLFEFISEEKGSQPLVRK